MCGRQASVFASNYCRNTLQQPSEFKPTRCYSFTFLEIRRLNSGRQKDGFSVGELREESLYSSTSKRHSLSMTLTVPAYPFYCHILQMANQQPWLSNLFVLMFSIQPHLQIPFYHMWGESQVRGWGFSCVHLSIIHLPPAAQNWCRRARTFILAHVTGPAYSPSLSMHEVHTHTHTHTYKKKNTWC